MTNPPYYNGKSKVEARLYDHLKDKEVVYSYELEAQYIEGVEYMWTEGNYSCDDNRGMFVAEVLGEPDPDYPCGDDVVELRELTIDGKSIL